MEIKLHKVVDASYLIWLQYGAPLFAASQVALQDMYRPTDDFMSRTFHWSLVIGGVHRRVAWLDADRFDNSSLIPNQRKKKMCTFASV